MTPAQLATLKTDATANFAALVAATDWPSIAAAYNLPSSPAVTIWRADIKPVEVIDAITGSEFIALTPQHQAMLSLLLQPGVVDATSANVRADFSAIFSAGSSLTALIGDGAAHGHAARSAIHHFRNLGGLRLHADR